MISQPASPSASLTITSKACFQAIPLKGLSFHNEPNPSVCVFAVRIRFLWATCMVTGDKGRTGNQLDARQPAVAVGCPQKSKGNMPGL